MLDATTSMRFEIIIGMSCPNGATSYLMVGTPIHLRAASLISTSSPSAFLLDGSSEE
jgi:hypothetical protein